jgi:hypothetical protein
MGKQFKRSQRRLQSELSGIFIQDCLAVDVQIARSSAEGPWHLSCGSGNGGYLSWQIEFDTDSAAWEYFLKVVGRYGMETIAGMLSHGVV